MGLGPTIIRRADGSPHGTRGWIDDESRQRQRRFEPDETNERTLFEEMIQNDDDNDDAMRGELMMIIATR